MAGLLISIFSDSEDLVFKVKDSFRTNKRLKLSSEIVEDELNIVKYMRVWEEKDLNVYKNANYIVLCAGIITLNDCLLDNVLHSIIKMLEIGKSIDEICFEIDGSFCLVIYEKAKQRLHVITDAVGVLHIYHYSSGNFNLISTSELVIARTLTVTPSITSMAQFLRSSYVLDEDTMFQEIKCLEPGTHYSFDMKDKSTTKRKYHEFPSEINRSIKFDEAANRLESEVGNIINLFPKGKTLVDLTGGNDSRSIMSYVYKMGEEKTNISALFTGPPESYEYQLVKETCAELGIKFYDFLPNEEFEKDFYKYFQVSHELCSGEENAAFHAPIYWSNLNKVRSGFQYSMHGSGGELYRDARWDQEFGKRGKSKPANLLKLINWRVFQYEYNKDIFSSEFLALINKVPELFLKSYKKTVSKIDPQKGTNTLQLDTIYLMQNMRKWGGATISSTNQVICSVSPFLFKKPLNTTLSINPDYRKGGRLNKAIAENIAPELAKQKMQTGSPFMVWKIGRFYLFIPFYSFLTKKLLRKLSQVLFHKTVFSKVTVHDFNLLPRFNSALETSECSQLLNYDNMVTKKLYGRNAFNDFIKKAQKPEFKHYKTLGNIMTIESTMRQAKLTKSIEFTD